MNAVPIEFQSPESIRDFQFERFKETLRYISVHSPFYKRHLRDHGTNFDSLRSLADCVKLPVTTKDDLQRDNWDFLCVPRTRVIEYTSTSGTLGKPVTIALTEHDLRRLARNEYISFNCADGTSADIYQLTVTLDRQFMAGLAYYEGIRECGAGLIRVGPGFPAMQWETIHRLNPTALVAVPSFILKLMEYAGNHGIACNDSSVRKIICIGESIRDADLNPNILNKKITDTWNVQLYSTYASTEMQTAFTECSHGQGGHGHPELMYVEVLDENNMPVAPGIIGEVTATTFGIEGMPFLRYKTGDMAKSYEGLCACGRNTIRIGPVLGRKQQMIKLKGTSLYPQGVFEILNQSNLIQNYVVEAITGELGTDEITLLIVAREQDQAMVEHETTATFRSRLRVTPKIRFLTALEVEKIQLSGNSRKANRFLDRRITSHS